MHIAVKKWGNSQGVIIPSPVLEQIGAQIGSRLDVTVHNGELILRPQKVAFFSEAYLLEGLDEHLSHADELAELTSLEAGL